MPLEHINNPEEQRKYEARKKRGSSGKSRGKKTKRTKKTFNHQPSKLDKR